MKIKVDDQELFELTDIQKKVIKNDINSDVFDDDMKRRLFWVINHKYEQCFKRLKNEWEPKLHAKGVSTPPSKDAFAELVFAESNYKDKKVKDEEAKAKLK